MLSYLIKPCLFGRGSPEDWIWITSAPPMFHSSRPPPSVRMNVSTPLVYPFSPWRNVTTSASAGKGVIKKLRNRPGGTQPLMTFVSMMRDMALSFFKLDVKRLGEEQQTIYSHNPVASIKV